MSDFMGADLDQLEQLATGFTDAGMEISAKAETLRARVNAAVSSFEETLAALQTDAASLVDSMDEEIASVSQQATGVAWTGANQGAFVGDVAAFEGAVRTGGAQINDDIGTIKTRVTTGFSPVLTEFGAALSTSAEDVAASTDQMKTAVANQRANLDQAANVGWTSA